MRKLEFSALRIVWVILMLGGACAGPGIDFNSQTGGQGGSLATGGLSFAGTGESGTSSTPDVGTGGITGMGASGGPGNGSRGGADGGSDAAGGAAGGHGGATDAGGGAPIGDPSGGLEWEPWPTVEPAPEGMCVTMQLKGGDESSTAELVRQETWRYNPATRVLTRNGTTIGYPSTVSYVRFDAQGRREMICEFDGALDCLEWTRDAAGNSTGYAYYGVKDGPLDERALDPAHPPTRMSPTGGGPDSERHTVTYDAAGLISTGTYYYPERGATLGFSRDSEGRCSDVVWTIPQSQQSQQSPLVEVDHWTHLGDKLVSRSVSLVNDPSDVRAVITYAYAADGTLAATAVDGGLDFPDNYLTTPPRDGVVDYVVRTSKQADGARWIELLYFELDDERNNARVMRQGALTDVLRVRYYMSPACEALSLPRHTSQACEFERPLSSGAPLAWHNPLVTPIPVGSMTPMPD